MKYFCTNCWKEIKAEDKICTNCGMQQDQLVKESFVEKLIRALNHPEPATPIRAANILAKINAKEAVPSLLNRLKGERDPFILEAFVITILKLSPGMKSQLKMFFKDNLPIRIKSILE